MRPDKLRAVVFVAALSVWGAGWAGAHRRCGAAERGIAGGSHLQPRRRPDLLRQVRGLSSARRGRADVAHHLSRCASVGERDPREGHHARHATVACGSAVRIVPERPQSHAARDRHDCRVGQGGRERGRSVELPALPKFPEGWQIGQPDQVFQMQADYQVPATGTIDYQYFEVPTNFTEDRWMQAGEVRAGDRAHVHHIIVYVREAKPSNRPNVVAVRPIIAAGQAIAPPPRANQARRVRRDRQRPAAVTPCSSTAADGREGARFMYPGRPPSPASSTLISITLPATASACNACGLMLARTTASGDIQPASSPTRRLPQTQPSCSESQNRRLKNLYRQRTGSGQCTSHAYAAATWHHDVVTTMVQSSVGLRPPTVQWQLSHY